MNKENNEIDKILDAAETTETTADAANEPESDKPSKPKKEKKRRTAGAKRRLQYRAGFTATIVIAVALVILLNVIVGVVADRFPITLDISKDKAYTLSEQSVEIAKLGLKVAVVSAVTGAVAAEFIGGGMGFGEQIRVAASRLALDRVFALIICLSFLGLALFSLVSWLQRRITFWDTPKIFRSVRKVTK